MSLDFGFNFRGTLGFVTDPLADAFIAQSAGYSTTFTNGNGQQIAGGWVSAPTNSLDRTAYSGDSARVSGLAFTNVLVTATFRIDLNTGSGGGATTYQIRLALGDSIGATAGAYLEVFDDTTSLIALSNVSCGIDEYIDASGVTRTSNTDWATNNASVTKTFASTICKIVVGDASSGTFSGISHFRLVEGAGSAGFGPLIAPYRNYPVIA